MNVIGKFFNPANLVIASSTSATPGSGSQQSNNEGGTLMGADHE